MNIMQKLYLHQNMKTLDKKANESKWQSSFSTLYHVIKPFVYNGRFYNEGDIVLFSVEELDEMKVMLRLDDYIEAGEYYAINREPII